MTKKNKTGNICKELKILRIGMKEEEDDEERKEKRHYIHSSFESKNS